MAFGQEHATKSKKNAVCPVPRWHCSILIWHSQSAACARVHSVRRENRPANRIAVARRGASIDTGSGGPNNARMAKPEIVRRVKSYSSESGYVYQYQFHDAVPAERNGEPGNEYIYYVSADRKTMFPMRIFVGRNTREDCARRLGRTLNGTEEYAVAKMRLFQAFDESEDLATKRPELVVDASNIEALLARLDL